jgi:hypothetical protein
MGNSYLNKFINISLNYFSLSNKMNITQIIEFPFKVIKGIIQAIIKGYSYDGPPKNYEYCSSATSMAQNPLLGVDYIDLMY